MKNKKVKNIILIIIIAAVLVIGIIGCTMLAEFIPAVYNTASSVHPECAVRHYHTSG